MKSRQEIERLSRQKIKKRLMLILLCVMVVSIVAAIILVNFIPKNEEETDSTTANKVEVPEILEGEALYNNYAIAYPTVQESQIVAIKITNNASYKNDYNTEEQAPKTSYTLMRDKTMGGKFVLYYEDKDGKTQVYYPDVVEQDLSFDYESLYAIEQNDGYGRIYKLTYLCVALELPYFTDRIELAPEGEARDSQLKGFGLDEESCTTISFIYKDADGKEKNRKIKIGDKNVTEVGYYFMVDDRPYIYNSMANYYDYAMLGFYSYVNSILVSAGLEEDSSYEPYLTTDYKQWLNEKFTEPGTEIPSSSSVIVYSDVWIPLESHLDVPDAEKNDELLYDSEVGEENKNGYDKDGYAQIELDLSDKDKYSSFIKALVGRELGEFSEDIVVTLSTDSKTVDFGQLSKITYEYEIFEIEAIVTDGADITETGYPVGDNARVRVAYYLTVDGKRISDVPYHGVIDISRSVLLENEGIQKIKSSAVGPLSQNISLKIDYTEENSVPVMIEYVIDEIIEIYDSKGNAITKIAEDSTVYYRYYFKRNGEKLGYNTAGVNLATEDSVTGLKIKERLIGLGLEKNLDITAYSEIVRCEFMQDFMTYSIKRADYFITSELVSAFRFLNRSERDPYYGESIYENTMDNEYSLYAMNSSACEAVAKMLGGIGDTSGSSEGLIGLETVAVGITPAIKERYGLYAHTVYFELPRGVIVRDSGDENTVDDYSHYGTLGFNIYISEEKYDSDLKAYIRYVGSDLYDVVCKVSADKLEFLNYNFIDFWARRSLMMFDVNYLYEMKVEFTMEDVKGSYVFGVNNRTGYFVTGANGGQKLVFEEPEEHLGSYDFLTVFVSDMCECEGTCSCTQTNIKELIKQNNGKSVSLSRLYNEFLRDTTGVSYTSDGSAYIGYDTAGTSYFKDLMGVLYALQYSGSLTKEEQNAVDPAMLLMRISIELNPNKIEKPDPVTHVYEFYRCADGRVMVRLYEQDIESGEITSGGCVSDFYVSNYTFKKIVANYFTLLNGQKIDSEEAYPDMSK